MQFDLKNVKVSYTIREVMVTSAFLLGLVVTYVKTEIQNSDLQSQIVVIRNDLAKCRAEIAQRNVRTSNN